RDSLEDAHNLEEIGCSLDTDGGPGMLYDSAFTDPGDRPVPVSAGSYANAARADGKVDIFMWDGKTRPDSLFPDTSGSKKV
ncbi:nitrate reductase subunit beta, partial [Rothia nasimurium]|nr:nitrate reductase subunit beta [Rothia nasimurium]